MYHRSYRIRMDVIPNYRIVIGSCRMDQELQELNLNGEEYITRAVDEI